MRFLIALISIASSIAPAAASAQATTTPERPEDVPPSTVVIDRPPALPPPPVGAPATGVVLERPGRVLLYGEPIRVRFQSPTNGVGFHLRLGGSYSSISGVSFGVGWAGGWGWAGYGMGYGGVAPYYGEVVTRAYQPICEAPCDAKILSGRHRLALSLGGNRPIEIERPIDLMTDSVVEGRYVDKSRMRKAGWALFGAGAISGMALMFASVNYNYDPRFGQSIRYTGMFYTGLGLFLASIITGSVLASQDDEAYVNVYPRE